MSQNAITTKRRLAFIDVLRGLAALWMIETHSVNEFLAPIFKIGFPYSLLNISNGFVSVMFIFCAGAGFWLALERKQDDFRRFGASFRSYLARLFFILGVAYMLQTPKFSLARTLHLSHDDAIRLLQCNVLHLIVFSSLFALFVSIIIKNNSILRTLFVGVTALVAFLTPLIRSFDPFLYMGAFPAALIAGQPISLFPLFPWSCYFFAGAAATSFFRNSTDQSLFAKRLAVISFVVIAAVFFVKDALHIYSNQAQWWSISPEHTLFRIFGALFLFSIFYLAEARFVGRTGQVLVMAGQESLFIYVLQGMIIYGEIGKFKLSDFVNSHLNYMEVSALIAAIAVFCIFSAALWHKAKRDYPEIARKYARIAIAIILFLFVVFPAKF